MKSIQQNVTVHFQYPVHFTQGLFSIENTDFTSIMPQGQRHKICFVIDDQVANLHPELVDNIQKYCAHHQTDLNLVTSPLIVPGGEQSKNTTKYLEQIQDLCEEKKLCRHSFVCAIGGGAVIDMVGYAVATPHRGLRLIRVPTTVLGQNDSGVGVKNSLNGFGKKNFFGTFAPPFAVLNDSDFLTTLNQRDWLGGISEAVKVALLKDAHFFDFLETNAAALRQRNIEAMEKTIYRCAELHLNHIATSGDPFEMGQARPLDFGHWAAHKMESLSNYEIRHGEAVAAGIALDTHYSYLQGWISKEESERVVGLFQNLGLKIYYENISHEQILKGLEEFQEHLGGRLCITLLEGIGKSKEVHEMDHKLIEESLQFLCAKQEKETLVEL